MENNSETGRWVEEHLAVLTPPSGWEADTGAGLDRFRMGRRARRVRNHAFGWTAAALVAGVMAFPSTRVLARRCVDACLAPLYQKTEPSAGSTSADFTLRDAGGNAVHLSDFRGRVVLLNFWATWCGPCKVEIPWFIDFEQRYRDAGLTVLGVSMDDDGWESVTPFSQQAGIDYRLVLGNEDVAAQFGGVESLPTTFLIDRSGRVAATFEGLAKRETYEDAIQHLLAEK